MRWPTHLLQLHRLAVHLIAAALLLVPLPVFAQKPPAPPSSGAAFTDVPELKGGFRLLYNQKFKEARQVFTAWESRHPDDPFGEVAVAATYLYEELFAKGVLTSDFFLDNNKFLHGIDGKPDAALMSNFAGALQRTRDLANLRLKKNPQDAEALYGLTLAAGMESDANAILEKRPLDALHRMKEANEYAKQLLALQPDATDAYVALGIGNFIIGSLNPGYRFGLWFMGIHGDKKLGMEEVAKAAENGRYLQPFAKIMLALAARREKQPALAERLLHELTVEFPDSPLFAAEYAKAMGQPIPAKIIPATR
ncbi:MAG TPA: hypothetical protein VGI16_13625 [Candidatus Acidoferrum sp.]|jgi:hypothetical protein